MNKIEDILEKLIKQKHLTIEESKKIAQMIFDENLSNEKITLILKLLFQKKETFEEIFGFVEYLKSKCKKITLKGKIMDTCGTGGDNKNSFNFSTATSILLSTFDISIAKHGNRSITSKSGSFDVLEALGIPIYDDLLKIKSYYKSHGICFLFAPYFHSSLKKISKIRMELPFRTIFNLLGPLLNPVDLSYQLIGVSNKENLESHARCLKEKNIRKAWIVHNENGYDELTTTSNNLIIEVHNNKISKVKRLNPKELGFTIRKEAELKGGTASENAFIMQRLFEGESGGIRDNVVLNTAVGLLICEKVNNLKEGII